MAIGAELLFNINLPINFYSPYKAVDIQDFWRRWHITLSRFLKEYLYIPLGGNRKGKFRTYLNLFITFLLGGIWHGAGWTFVVWGGLHGGALVIHRLWQQIGVRMPKILGWFITFNFINIAWVFFRAHDFKDAMKVLNGMFDGSFVYHYGWVFGEKVSGWGMNVGEWSKMFIGDSWVWLWLFFGFVVVLFFPNSIQMRDRFKTNSMFLGMTLFFFLSLFFLYRKSEFIYFNF
jgi:hypothetical protein